MNTTAKTTQFYQTPPQPQRRAPSAKRARRPIRDKVVRVSKEIPAIAHHYVAALNPFSVKVPRGPSHCAPGMPSQKLTSKARVSFVVPTGQVALVMCSPCVVNNPNSCSAAVLVNTFAGLNAALNAQTVAPTYLATATPYNSTTLINNQYFWRSVASGVKIRYTGTELQRGGRLYALQDPNTTLAPAWGSSTNAQTLASAVIAANNVVVGNWSEKIEYEFSMFGAMQSNDAYYSSASSVPNAGFWPVSAGNNGDYVDGASIKLAAGSDRYLGQPVLYFYLQNTTGTASLEFEIETIEHWEFANEATLGSLHTPSYGSRATHDAITHLQHSAALQRTSSPKKSWVDVVKDVAKSPMVAPILKDAPIVAGILALL